MNTAVAERQINPVQEVRIQLERMQPQFQHALPAHIPVERFMRVVMTAVQNNPDLLTADRQSLFNACMKAAQDGLLPDGREGAIVVYKTKVRRDGVEEWIQKAQWMPMVFGILKKIRNSGHLAMITARVVYGGDKYRYWIDDSGEHILYEPAEKPDLSIVQRVFAMARTKDGELMVEPLTANDIEKIRNVSRAKDNGPWVNWWEEMAKKSAIRRLSKKLPMSSDLDDLVRRDDELYDFEGARSEAKALNRPTLASALDQIAKPSNSEAPSPNNGATAVDHPSLPDKASAGPEHESASIAPANDFAADGSHASSANERTAPATRHPSAGADVPSTEGEYTMRVGAMIDKAKSSKELEGFLDTQAETVLQQQCGVSEETLDMLAKALNAKIEVLRKKGK